MEAHLNSIVLYTKKMDQMASFYGKFFGYSRHDFPGDRIVELRPDTSGFFLLLHPAAKSVRQGQSTVKLTFTVPNVAAFCDTCAANGLMFGPLHTAEGYVFANAKDPSGNSICVSERLARN